VDAIVVATEIPVAEYVVLFKRAIFEPTPP
jgi:hypothetical protein